MKIFTVEPDEKQNQLQTLLVLLQADLKSALEFGYYNRVATVQTVGNKWGILQLKINSQFLQRSCYLKTT